MEIREISPSDTLELRQCVLRPGLRLDQCVYAGDDDSTTHHFGCIVDDGLVGIVSIYKRDKVDLYSGCGFQIRAMATAESFRGKGLGLDLLRAAEKKAFTLGADYIWANARIAAVGFYRKSGYTIGENEFEIIDVGPHVLVSLVQSQHRSSV